MDSYIGEIRLFAGGFVPAGWALCDGSLLPISENEALFQLIGTTYGGDGQTTFALPDLRGRVPVHQGQPPGGRPYSLSEQGGAETVALTRGQMPVHAHQVLASSSPATSEVPQDRHPAATTARTYAATGDEHMAADALSATGGAQPHENLPPFLVVLPIISVYGIFPTPT